MKTMILNAFALICMAYALLFVIASAMPKSKHDEWHDYDGKCKNFRPYEGEEHKGDCAELVGLESCVYEDDFCSYGEWKEGAD